MSTMLICEYCKKPLTSRDELHTVCDCAEYMRQRITELEARVAEDKQFMNDCLDLYNLPGLTPEPLENIDVIKFGLIRMCSEGAEARSKVISDEVLDECINALTKSPILATLNGEEGNRKAVTALRKARSK